MLKLVIKIIFSLILIFSCYHLIRDILQILDWHNAFTNVLHRPHQWCKPYCDYVTLPLDILGIYGSIVVLKRNRLGVLGMIVLLSFPVWLMAALLP